MINVEAIQERLKHYNLKSVADDMGVHENILYRFMKGQDPRFSTVEKIVSWLDKKEKKNES